jgi:hypothetical protein
MSPDARRKALQEQYSKEHRAQRNWMPTRSAHETGRAHEQHLDIHFGLSPTKARAARIENGAAALLALRRGGDLDSEAGDGGGAASPTLDEVHRDELRAHRRQQEVASGLGRIVALYYIASTIYQIHEHVRRLCL